MAYFALAAVGLAMLGGMTTQPANQERPRTERQSAERRVKPTLLAEQAEVTPGSTLWLGVRFDIEPGWHIYWNGLNDTGFPPRFNWQPTEGVTFGEPLWPSPIRHINPGEILDHIYENRVMLLVPVTISKDAKHGSLTLKGEVKWLVCKEACIPESAQVELTTRIAEKPVAAAEAVAREFAAARALMPQRMPKDGSMKAVLSKDGKTLEIDAPKAVGIAFFPAAKSREVENPVKTATGDGESLKVPLVGGDGAAKSPVVGIIEVRWKKDSRQCYWFDSTERPDKPLNIKDLDSHGSYSSPRP